jgi:hypothetical protein
LKSKVFTILDPQKCIRISVNHRNEKRFDTELFKILLHSRDKKLDFIKTLNYIVHNSMMRKLSKYKEIP